MTTYSVVLQLKGSASPKEVEVKDFDEASRVVVAFQDEHGVGASGVGPYHGLLSTDGVNSHRVSYNGRIWPIGAQVRDYNEPSTIDFHAGVAPAGDCASKLRRAKALYVKASTRAIAANISHAEEMIRKWGSKGTSSKKAKANAEENVRRWQLDLKERREQLHRQEQSLGDLFDQVVSGELEP